MTGIKNRGGPSIGVEGTLTFRHQGGEESAGEGLRRGGSRRQCERYRVQKQGKNTFFKEEEVINCFK